MTNEYERSLLETKSGLSSDEIAAKTAKRDFLTKDDGTMWDRRLWAVPMMIFGGNPFDGVSFDPHTDFNSHKYQSTLHHSAG